MCIFWNVSTVKLGQEPNIFITENEAKDTDA